MNKKILATALLAGLALGMGSTAYAAESPKTADVTYKMDSSFTMRIPTTVTEIAGAGATMSVGAATWNIPVKEALYISMGSANPSLSNGILTLLNEDDQERKVTAQLTLDQALISPNSELLKVDTSININPDTPSLVTLNLSPVIESTPLAGTYKATLTFVGEIK